LSRLLIAFHPKALIKCWMLTAGLLAFRIADAFPGIIQVAWDCQQRTDGSQLRGQLRI